MKFYVCRTCGNLITKINDSKVPVMCCGKAMEEIVAGSVEASQEKHIPVYALDGNKVFVMVGDVEHPMQAEHYIQWIVLETKQGVQIKYLEPENPPVVSFSMVEGDEVVAVLEYCNLHGLWMA